MKKQKKHKHKFETLKIIRVTSWFVLRDEILRDMGFEGLVESNECPSWAVEIANRLIDRRWVKP